VFIDIGAARPEFLSMSALYRLKDWKVLAIEPNPAYQRHYAALGLEVLPYAVGDHEGDDVEFSVVNSHGTDYRGGNLSYESYSSLAIKDSYDTPANSLDISKISVRLRTLDSILQQHAPEVDQIDIISIDIEGWELEALSGLSFDRYRPKLLIVENLRYDAGYRRFMEGRGYLLWRCIPPNDIYVKASLIDSTMERTVSGVQSALVTAVGRLRVAGGKIWRAYQRRN